MFETIRKLQSRRLAPRLSILVERASPCIDGFNLVLEDPEDVGILDDCSCGE